jgi:hypothetical protein
MIMRLVNLGVGTPAMADIRGPPEITRTDGDGAVFGDTWSDRGS